MLFSRSTAGVTAVVAVASLLSSPMAEAQLSTIGNQFFHQDVPGILENAEPDDDFGAAVAAGDFNNDGIDDLAIGVPAEGFSGLDDAGVVQVFYGSSGGVGIAGNQLWDQSAPGILGSAESGDFFGISLATGDFDNDGFEDLAIGVAGEAIGTLPQAGAVNVLYGSPSGLAAAGNQLWHQDSAGVLDAPSPSICSVLLGRRRLRQRWL